MTVKVSFNGEEERHHPTERNLHFLFLLTLDNRGGFLVVQHSNVQDLTGVSQTTGVVYHGQSANTGTVIQGKVGSETTFTDVFMLISQSAPAVAVQGVGHMTVNPDGTVTATFNISNVRCT